MTTPAGIGGRRAGPEGSTRATPLALLAERSFLAVWFAGAVSSTVRWLEMLAMGVFVFDLTGSPVQVAIVSILRMVPLTLFGALVGTLAERAPRKAILMVGLGGMAATSLGLAILAYLGEIRFWHLAAGATLSGLYWVTDLPVRRMVLGELAGERRVGAAMSLDSVTNNGTRALGPLLGGVLLEVLGLAGTFALSAALYLAGMAALSQLEHAERTARARDRASVLASTLAGIRLALSDRTLTGLLTITVIFNLFGFPFVTMVPVIGKEVLGLSALPVGLLAAAEGTGALAGALLLTFFARAGAFRLLYVSGVALYLTMALGFGQSGAAPLSGVLLLIAGLGGAAFAAMQSTLVFLCTPEEARSRVMGVLTVCIGTAPLGFLHIGLLANLLGAPAAVSVTAVEGMIALTAAVVIWPELGHPQRLPE